MSTRIAAPRQIRKWGKIYYVTGPHTEKEVKEITQNTRYWPQGYEFSFYQYSELEERANTACVNIYWTPLVKH